MSYSYSYKPTLSSNTASNQPSSYNQPAAYSYQTSSYNQPSYGNRQQESYSRADPARDSYSRADPARQAYGAQQSNETPVKQLSSTQLQAALKARGVRMPTTTQTHAWYLSRAAEIGLDYVPNSELQRGGPPQATATASPGRVSGTASPGRGQGNSSTRFEVVVVDVQLHSDMMRGSSRPRSLSVRVEPPPGVEAGTRPEQLITRTVGVGGGTAPKVRFDSTHSIPLERNSVRNK